MLREIWIIWGFIDSLGRLDEDETPAGVQDPAEGEFAHAQAAGSAHMGKEWTHQGYCNLPIGHPP